MEDKLYKDNVIIKYLFILIFKINILIKCIRCILKYLFKKRLIMSFII